MLYDDDQMLMLSGIQHYMFCPRQWALIHIEQQWDENRLTAEGQLLHQNVDNPAYRQKNGDVITLRSVHVASHTLGLYGIHIPEAALFYHETRHREAVPIDEHLRQLTCELSEAMHRTFESGFTPKVKEKRECRSCSLRDVCAPELTKSSSVAYYLKKTLDEETA